MDTRSALGVVGAGLVLAMVTGCAATLSPSAGAALRGANATPEPTTTPTPTAASPTAAGSASITLSGQLSGTMAQPQVVCSVANVFFATGMVQGTELQMMVAGPDPANETPAGQIFLAVGAVGPDRPQWVTNAPALTTFDYAHTTTFSAELQPAAWEASPEPTPQATSPVHVTGTIDC